MPSSRLPWSSQYAASEVPAVCAFADHRVPSEPVARLHLPRAAAAVNHVPIVRITTDVTRREFVVGALHRVI